jgi:hypothetical protein
MTSVACSSGVCGGTCNSGFLDCNGNKQKDGCETNSNTDKNNCGNCGNVCSGTTPNCSNGTCVAGPSCNTNILVLGTGSTTTSSQLISAFTAAGLNVSTTYVASSYSGSPAATGYGAVFVGGYESYGSDMPAAGQTSIYNALQAGTGIVWTDWMSYTYSTYTTTWTTLRPFMLTSYSGSSAANALISLTSSGHAIWTGLPGSSFTPALATPEWGIDTLNGNGGSVIVNCTGCGSAGFVTVRDNGTQRVVQSALTANYASWTGDANMTKLVTNMVKWAAHCL